MLLAKIMAGEPAMSVQDGSGGLFEEARRERRDRYADLTALLDRVAESRAGSLQRLQRDGYAFLPGHVPEETALGIERTVDSFCASGRQLQPPARVAGLAREVDYREASRLDETELSLGVDHYRYLTSAVNVADPLVALPEIVDIAFDPKLLELAGAYLGCPPLLGFVKVTRSLVNGLRPFDTEEFHVDGNSTSLVKAFVHLHDTDVGAGPHQFVRASHRERIVGWDVSARASEDLIEERYGRDRMVVHGARAGDVVLEDTSGFHRRLKAKSRDRTILILNYVVHDEYGGGGAKTKIRASDIARLDRRQRSAAELLEAVGEST